MEKKLFKVGMYVHGKSFKELGATSYKYHKWSEAGVSLFIDCYKDYDEEAGCWKFRTCGNTGSCVMLESEVREWDKYSHNVEEYEIY